MKTCACCKEEKENRHFGTDRGRKDGHNPYCQSCVRRKSKEQKRDPVRERAYARRWETINANKVRGYQAKYRYGITVDEYEAMLTEQQRQCAICRTDKPGYGQNWNIDHDHASGKVRGLLCGRCNRGIGLLGDDPERLQAAIDYLTRAQARVN